MMRFACPACNAAMNAPDGKAGKKAVCPRCGQRLRIPAPTAERTMLAKPLPPKGQSATDKSKPAAKTPDWLADNQGLGQVPPVSSDPAASEVYNFEGGGGSVPPPPVRRGAAVPPSSDRASPASVPIHAPLETGVEAENTYLYDRPNPPNKLMGRVVLSAILLGLVLAAGWVSVPAFQGSAKSVARADEKQQDAKEKLRDGDPRVKATEKPQNAVRPVAVDEKQLFANPDRIAAEKQAIANPGLMGNEKQLMLDYLQKKLNDRTGVEVVEWDGPKAVLVRHAASISDVLNNLIGKRVEQPPWTPAVYAYVKYRAKSRLGATELEGRVFLIENGKIVQSAGLTKEASDPLGFAKERLGEMKECDAP
jgi:hypothetical protein